MADAFSDAFEAALKRLRQRELFAGEVQSYLIERGTDAEIVQRVVARLLDRAILDDRRTINNAIERNSGKRSMGKWKLRASLVARGAPEDILDLCLAELDACDEVARLDELLRSRKFGSPAQAGRWLLSRGFEEDAVREAVDRFYGISAEPE